MSGLTCGTQASRIHLYLMNLGLYTKLTQEENWLHTNLMRFYLKTNWIISNLSSIYISQPFFNFSIVRFGITNMWVIFQYSLHMWANFLIRRECPFSELTSYFFLKDWFFFLIDRNLDSCTMLPNKLKLKLKLMVKIPYYILYTL